MKFDEVSTAPQVHLCITTFQCFFADNADEEFGPDPPSLPDTPRKGKKRKAGKPAAEKKEKKQKKDKKKKKGKVEVEEVQVHTSLMRQRDRLKANCRLSTKEPPPLH